MRTAFAIAAAVFTLAACGGGGSGGSPQSPTSMRQPVVDTDGDGVPDAQDAFPNDPAETRDSDGDGVGDNVDAFPNDSTRTTRDPRGNGQERADAGLHRIAVNGAFPANHAQIVKPQFAVIESSPDSRHGGAVQAAACLGYAPGGCTISSDPVTDYRVSNAPFIYLEGPPGTPDYGFSSTTLTTALQRHPTLKLASISATLVVGYARSITDEGVVHVWSAGNEGTADFRRSLPNSFDDPHTPPDHPLHGNVFIRQLENNDGLVVAGYAKQNGVFVRASQSTGCGGIDGGCLYAPFVYTPVAGETVAGTSYSAPFVAAGLASVLAVFPQTPGKSLIRLAKACAVPEPGLNGLGRFSLACMDNSPVFHLNKGTTAAEETAATVQARSAVMETAFQNTALPGDSVFTMPVQGVSLSRDLHGTFDYRAGLMPPELEPEEPEQFRLSYFHDKARKVPGFRFGNRDLFLAASWAQNEPQFMGIDGYRVESFNMAAGTGNAFVRLSEQRGEHTGRGVVSSVSGRAIGATVRRKFATPVGEAVPYLHLDRFAGGEAETAFGTMALKGSAWNAELGLAVTTPVGRGARLSFGVSAFDRASGEDGQRVQAGYRVEF